VSCLLAEALSTYSGGPQPKVYVTTDLHRCTPMKSVLLSPGIYEGIEDFSRCLCLELISVNPCPSVVLLLGCGFAAPGESVCICGCIETKEGTAPDQLHILNCRGNRLAAPEFTSVQPHSPIQQGKPAPRMENRLCISGCRESTNGGRPRRHGRR